LINSAIGVIILVKSVFILMRIVVLLVKILQK
jgi:hypothetical protein